MIILVSLHNIHVLNYTRNIFLKIAYQTPENHFQAHFQGHYQTLKNETVF